MLSFLREQGFEDSLENDTTKSANGDDVKHQYLKSSKSKEQQYLTVAAQGKNVRKMTMMLAALFVIGLLGLLFMIKKSVPQTATAASVNAEETEIEKAIERLTGVGSEMFKRMDQIVKKFYEFSDVSQVRVYELVKNPFERQIILAGSTEIPDSNNADLIRQQRIKEGETKLQLFTILKTDQGYSCMINDKILYEGDVIEGFKVCRINETSVKLELEGAEIVKKLSE